MTKLVLSNVVSGYNLTTINDNFSKISAELQDKVLYRNNTSLETNTMSQSLDMAGFSILNVAKGVNSTDIATLADVQQAISGLPSANLVPNTPAGNIAATTVQGALNELDAEKAKVGANSDITALTGLTTPISLVLLRGYIDGFNISTSGPSTTMNVSAGQAVDSDNAYPITVAAKSKTTGAWAVGSGNGGLDTGTIANNTWYHFYAIRRTDTGVTDIVFSANASSPTLPTSYTQYRRIFSWKTNGSAQWIPGVSKGNNFIYDAPILDYNTAISVTTAVAITVSTPLGIKNQWVGWLGTSGLDTFQITDPDTTDTATTTTNGMISFTTASQTSLVPIFTNTTPQIRIRASAGAGGTFRLVTYGWIDSRGKDI